MPLVRAAPVAKAPGRHGHTDTRTPPAACCCLQLLRSAAAMCELNPQLYIPMGTDS